MGKYNYIIVGNGIAGLSAAETIRKNDKSSKILIISLEEYLTYFRIRLCDLLADCDKEINLTMHDKDWYKSRNIELSLGETVTGINPSENTILTDKKNEYKYDKLIISCGSKSNLPKVEGCFKENVFTIRNLDDIKAICSKLANSKKAVIIGGGLLGLEAAYNLNKANVDTTILERGDRILTRQLDKKGSAVYEKIMSDLGIKIIKNSHVSKINGKAKACSVSTEEGKTIEADLVFFAAGVIPNIDIINNTDIETKRAIVVDKYMKSCMDNIFAAGDIAELDGKNYGLWTVAMDQGKIAGHNASQKNRNDYREYEAFIPPYFLNSMGTKLYCLGNIGRKEEQNSEVYEYILYKENIYHKLVFINNIIVGAIFIGETENAIKINNGIKNRIGKNEVFTILDKNKYIKI